MQKKTCDADRKLYNKVHHRGYRYYACKVMENDSIYREQVDKLQLRAKRDGRIDKTKSCKSLYDTLYGARIWSMLIMSTLRNDK
jgi:hypothetical protein